MRRIRKAPVFVFAAGLAAALLTLARFASRASQAPVSYKPFTATVLTEYFDEEGRLGRTEVALQGMRSDGSLAKLTETVNDRPAGRRTVSDVPRGLRVTIDPSTRSLTTYRWGSREAQAERDPSGGCRYAPDAPSRVILGLDVRRYETHWPAGERQIDEEGWVAPSLGCYPLERSYQVSESGQPVGRTTITVVSITIGDPPGELFEVPGNYAERKPSEVMALRAEKEGRPCPTCMAGSASSLDKVYDSRHRP
jgi:hypothetical protein